MVFATQRSAWIKICFLAGSLLSCSMAHAQNITQSDLQMLMPDEQDLQGFTRTMPAGEPSAVSATTNQTVDQIALGVDARQAPDGVIALLDRTATVSSLKRTLYTIDGTYRLTMTAMVYDTSGDAQAAVNSFRGSSSAAFTSGTFSGPSPVGDESWINPNGYSTLIFRIGRMAVLLSGLPSRIAGQNTAPFPPQEIDFIARTIWLRASGEAGLINSHRHTAHIAVDGRLLPHLASVLGSQLYVPVTEFAQAAKLKTRWNAKTGALTLSKAGRKHVTLTAGRATARVGTRTVALGTPLLKDRGRPVMALHDLLALVGGHVVTKGGMLRVTT